MFPHISDETTAVDHFVHRMKAKKGMTAECCGDAGSGRKMWRDVQKNDKKTQRSRTGGRTS